MKAEAKRLNFNVDPDQEAEIEELRRLLRASTTKDALLQAVRIVRTLGKELAGGKRLASIGPGDQQTGILIPDLEGQTPWKYLAERPHPWRKQLAIKGRRLYAANVWESMRANQMSVAETAANWDLPIEAVEEAIAYCEQNVELLLQESQIELQSLIEAGVAVEPPRR